MEELVHGALGTIQTLFLGLVFWLFREIKNRTLDPSEIKTFQQWAPRLGELAASIDRLQSTLHENGLDRTEVRRIRSFFFGTEQRGSELHALRGEIAEAKLGRERLVSRVEAIEHERRESNRQLDQRLERLEKQGADMLETMTEMLRRWPTQGIRTTPPGGHSLSERTPDDDEERD